MQNESDQLRTLEQSRCAAINDGRVDNLKTMLANDYVHIHMTGKIDTRDGHLEALRLRTRRTERGTLDIRIHDGFAILIGEQTNLIPQPDGSSRVVTAVCQQVAVRSAEGWQFLSCQLTRKEQGKP